MWLRWQKVENTDALAWMATDFPPGWRCPRTLAEVEARAVILTGMQKTWPVARLAKRWGWGKSQAYEVFGAAQRWVALLDPQPAAENEDRKVLEKAGIEPEQSGTDMASERQPIDIDRKCPELDRTVPEASCARVPSGEIKNKKRPISETWDARAGEPTVPSESDGHSAFADPGRLAAVWAEELKAMPPVLRGKSPGLGAMWEADLMAVGTESACEAIRALGELCRGTPNWLPRVFEWSALAGPRPLFPGVWREALAWRQGAGGEPKMGRTWRGDGRGDVQSGVGAGGGKAGRRKGQAIILGQGKYDPDDDGWGNAAPGEREAAEALAVRLNAERAAKRAAEAAAAGEPAGRSG